MAKTSVPKERLEKAMEAAGFDLIGEGRRLQFTDGVGSKMFRNWEEVEEYLNSRIFPDQIQENVYRALA